VLLPWLKAILRKHLSGLFGRKQFASRKPELLGLQLLTWIQNQTFGFAKDEGWLDALVFYGFRDIRSQGYWDVLGALRKRMEETTASVISHLCAVEAFILEMETPW